MVAPGFGAQCIGSLYSFVGYGPANPRFVFIGPEEGSEGSLIKLQTRCTTFPATRHDRAQACRDLAASFIAQGLPQDAQRYVEALNPGAEPTWTFAARIVAALRDPPTAWEDEYRRLGAPDGDTLLTELFPLPKPGTGNWPAPYVNIFGYQDQNAYYDALWPRAVIPGSGASARADLLASTLAAASLSRATYVFGYGRGGRRTEFLGTVRSVVRDRRQLDERDRRCSRDRPSRLGRARRSLGASVAQWDHCSVHPRVDRRHPELAVPDGSNMIVFHHHSTHDDRRVSKVG